MPTYAYACTTCDHRFEAQQSFSDAALTECPQCQGRLRKLFNSVGIVFKGSGFYRTDSRTGAASASSADSSSASTSTDSKSDSAATPAKSDSSTSKTDSSSGTKSTPATSTASSGSAA